MTAADPCGRHQGGRRAPAPLQTPASLDTSVCLAELATPECAKTTKQTLPSSKDAEGAGDADSPGPETTSASPRSPGRAALIGANVQGGGPASAACGAGDSAARLSERTEHATRGAECGEVTLRGQPESATAPGAAAPQGPMLRSALASRALPNLVTSWARASEPAASAKGGEQPRLLAQRSANPHRLCSSISIRSTVNSAWRLQAQRQSRLCRSGHRSRRRSSASPRHVPLVGRSARLSRGGLRCRPHSRWLCRTPCGRAPAPASVRLRWSRPEGSREPRRCAAPAQRLRLWCSAAGQQ